MGKDALLLPSTLSDLCSLKAFHGLKCPGCLKLSLNLMTGWKGDSVHALGKCDECGTTARFSKAYSRDRKLKDTLWDQQEFETVTIERINAGFITDDRHVSDPELLPSPVKRITKI